MSILHRLRTTLALFIAWLAIGSTISQALQLALAGLAPVLGGVDTEVLTGAAEAVKRWATKIWLEASKEIYWGKFIQENENAIIQLKTELEKGPGDKVTYTLLRKLTGAGVDDDATLEGNEEPLSWYSDSVTLAQKRNAVRLAGRMSERRTAFDQKLGAKTQLKTWLAETMDSQMFTGFDSAPTVVVYGGDATSTATIDAADKFTPALIDKAIAKAKKAVPKIWPVRYMGKDYYVVVVHTDIGFDLRRDPEWQQVQREANLQGLNNPIFTGMLGMWQGAIIHEHEAVPISVTYGAGGNVPGASNMFLGRQAGIMAYGARPEAWEKEFDYGSKAGFAIGAIWKFKKAVFNAADNSYIAIRTARTNN